MSFVAIKSKFHVALDGQGLILQGAPDRLAYKQEQAPVYNARFGEGDRSYNDLSAWWYFVQTSWAAGFKEVVSWLDDAMYLFSTNMDVYSEPGAIKLSKKQTLDNDFAASLACGTEGTVNSNFRKYVGMSSDAIFEAQPTWTDISSATFPAGITSISQLLTRQNYLWSMAVGTDATTTHVLAHFLTAWVDNTPFIEDATVLNYAVVTAHAAVEIGTTLYVAVSGTANQIAIVKTAVAAPASAADWSVVINRTQSGTIVDMGEYAGNLYYLIRFANGLYELRKYDIASSTDTSIYKIRTVNTSTSPTFGVGGKMLLTIAGKLVIILPKAIWTWNDITLTRVWEWSNDKNNIDTDANGNTLRGGVVSENKIFCDNIIYDGTYLYNWIKRLSDDVGGVNVLLFTDSTDTIYLYDSTDDTKLNKIGTTYKGTANKNYLVFNNFDLISGVDKLAYSATILFKPLISGQSIIIEYFLGELTSSSSWTVLGTASFALDAGVVTEKTFYFGAAVTFKKIWFRVKMTAGGSDTPVLTDVIMEYLPVPTFKKNWALNINCGDEVKRLDGALTSTVGRELKGRLERAWWTKSILDFQDLDYATTLLNGAISDPTATTITVDSTYDFPEQGRIRIENEEITYTGKTPTTFTGCTRGARSTRATTYTDNTVVNNAYKVILTDFSVRTPIALEDKELEYVVGINLKEV